MYTIKATNKSKQYGVLSVCDWMNHTISEQSCLHPFSMPIYYFKCETYLKSQNDVAEEKENGSIRCVCVCVRALKNCVVLVKQIKFLNSLRLFTSNIIIISYFSECDQLDAIFFPSSVSSFFALLFKEMCMRSEQDYTEP